LTLPAPRISLALEEGVRSLKVLRRKAHAKVNLFLEVLGERPDGYHEIETVMVKLALADEMAFHVRTDGKVTLRSEGLDIPAGENLAARAARLLKERTSSAQGLDIELRKKIPIGAGLGGGSSDAAVSLEAANDLWDLGLGRDELARLGAELGSDVPFFLLARAAVCRGRGERVEPFAVNAGPVVVLAHPGVRLATGDVYSNLSGKDLTGVRKRATEMAESLRVGGMNRLRAALFNRLEDAVLRLCPEVGALKSRMTTLGAGGVVMTGSGSAIAAFFSDSDAASHVAHHLESAGDPGGAQLP